MSHFPIKSIPESSLIRIYAERMDKISESSIQYHFASMIAGISASLGRKVSFDLGMHTLFPNAYILVVGESGITRKSSGVRPIVNMLRGLHSNIILPTNLSNESLIPSFNMCPTRLMFLDEMRMLFDLASKSFGSGIITTLTHIHECPNEIKSEFKKDFDENGKLREGSIAQFPFLTILGLTTQEWLNLSAADVTAGFLGRFWTITSVGEKQKTIPFPENDKDLFDKVRSKLVAIKFYNGKYTFSEETKLLWEAKYTSLMEEVRSHRSDQFSSFGSRLGDTLIKLCMIIAASMPNNEFIITPEIFNSACALTDYLKDSYADLLGCLTINEFSSDQTRLEKLFIRHQGRMTRTQISDSLRGKKKKELDEIIEILVERGTVLSMITQQNKKPKKEYFLTSMFTYDHEQKKLYNVDGVEIG